MSESTAVALSLMATIDSCEPCRSTGAELCARHEWAVYVLADE